jgi:hypothetical protein
MQNAILGDGFKESKDEEDQIHPDRFSSCSLSGSWNLDALMFVGCSERR